MVRRLKELSWPRTCTHKKATHTHTPQSALSTEYVKFRSSCGLWSVDCSAGRKDSKEGTLQYCANLGTSDGQSVWFCMCFVGERFLSRLVFMYYTVLVHLISSKSNKSSLEAGAPTGPKSGSRKEQEHTRHPRIAGFPPVHGFPWGNLELCCRTTYFP